MLLLLCQNHSQFRPAANHPQCSRHGKAEAGCGNASQGVPSVSKLQKHHWAGNVPLNQSSSRAQQNWRKQGVGGWAEEGTGKKSVKRANCFYCFHGHEIYGMAYFLWCVYVRCLTPATNEKYSFLICPLGFQLKPWHLYESQFMCTDTLFVISHTVGLWYGIPYSKMVLSASNFFGIYFSVPLFKFSVLENWILFILFIQAASIQVFSKIRFIPVK